MSPADLSWTITIVAAVLGLVEIFQTLDRLDWDGVENNLWRRRMRDTYPRFRW